MAAKEQLKKVKKLEVQMESVANELNKLAHMMTGLAKSDRHAPGAAPNVKSPQERYYPKYAEYEAELERSLDELWRLKRAAMEMVETLEDPLQIQILYMRYFQHSTWDEIAKATGLSSSQINRQHGTALRAIENSKRQKDIKWDKVG